MLTAWLVGLPLGIVFMLLRLIGIVRIYGLEKSKIIPQDSGLIAYYRHPSLREPLLIPLLFFPELLFQERLVPFSLPDKKNFYQKWWFFPIRPFCISIERGNQRAEMTALKQIKEKLMQGRIICWAPGGGREWKGKNFKNTKDGKYSIRAYEEGIGWLLEKVKMPVLPIWVEINGIVITMIVGKPFYTSSTLSRKQIVAVLEEKMLSLRES